MRKINYEMTHDYGYEVPPHSREDLTRLAHLVHQISGYKGVGPFPIMRFVELVLPEIYEDFELQVLRPRELGEKLGETYPSRHLIRLRQDIYDTAVDGQPLARMTVAHETGHLLVHNNIPIALARKQATKSIPAYRSSEWQANAFGGALLMPADKIIRLEPEEICELYNVTITAASTQLKAVRGKGAMWAKTFSL